MSGHENRKKKPEVESWEPKESFKKDWGGGGSMLEAARVRVP